MHQSAIVLVRCVPGSSLLPPPYWKARDPGDEVSYLQAPINIQHTNDDVFDGFPKISEDFPKLFRLPDERFRTFSKHFPKITEDSRRFLKTTEEDAKMFRSFDKFQCS